MEDLYNSLSNPNVIALIVSSAIFIVTVALISFRLINFVITCVLLFFAIASGLAIANNDIVRGYFNKQHNSSDQATPTTKDSKQLSDASESKLEAIRERLEIMFQQLVEVLSNHASDHKEEQEKAQHLKTTIENVLDELDQQKIQLQELLEEQ